MFLSRQDAGISLAQKLIQSKILADIVIGLPRGGILVALEISHKLKIPLDTLMVKKIGASFNQELAIGAISLDNISYVDEVLISILGIDKKLVQYEITKQSKNLKKREKILRSGKKSLVVKNKKVILTDDGVATGATVFAAISWLRKHHAKKIILALPLAPQELIGKLQNQVDLCIILETPVNFASVGQFYQDFKEVSDEEVIKILR